jgi:carboxypeptidase C (cathepsin A)
MRIRDLKQKGSVLAISWLCLAVACMATGPTPKPQLAAKNTEVQLPVLDMTLRPVKAADGTITHVEVAMGISALGQGAKKPLVFKASNRYASVTGAADRIENLQVTDRKGPVELKPLEDVSEAGGMVVWRRWQAARVTSGDVEVSYRARVPEPKPRRGPPFDLSLQGGGISGAGCGFMVFLDEPGPFKLQFHWDLKQLDPGSVGMTTLGESDFEAQATVDQLISCFFIAGPLGRYPEQGDVGGFRSAWLGTPPFDVHEVMAWTAKAFTALRTFFRTKDPETYRFFLIVGSQNTGVGGTALGNSFMLFAPTDAKLTGDPRGTIAHEMTHYWNAEFGDDAGSSFWFTEGLTVHYTSLLMYRAGLFTTAEYLEDVNGTAARYLTNPQRNLPNNRITELFWSDRNAQVIPYDRGSLYFANVDAEIRSASNGKRSLDDVILSLFDRRKNGEKLTQDMWLESLKKELGPSSLDEFESLIIRGDNFIPRSAAFGPEFERVPTTLHRYELGFDERIFTTRDKRVTGVVKGSAAERAGLRDGDQILNDVDLNAMRDIDDYRLKLKIKRGEETREIEYTPRAEGVEGYTWYRKFGVPGRPEIDAQADVRNMPSVTPHQGIFNGQKVDYTCEIEEVPVSDGEKGPSARIVSISYLAKDAGPRPGRPVIFIFNGGPIVPSSTLQMAAFGPKRIAFPDDLTADPATFPLVDNTYTVLDVADLVFFDPAGTGLSRLDEGTPRDAYFSVDADARQLAQFVEAWCRRHGRLDSPKYLFGESYGTLRAAVAAQKISRLDPPVRLDGVFLMGQALNIIETSSRPGNVISYVVSLPTLAALGWYHGRVDKKGRTLEQFLDEVRLFARTEFLTALFQGSSLPPAVRDRLARRLSELTGIPADFYAANNLRLNKYRFRTELLKGSHEVIGTNDGRYKTTAPKEGEIPDPSAVIGKAVANGFSQYVKGNLLIEEANYLKDAGVKDLEGWRWGSTSPFGDWPYMASISDALSRNPSLRVIIGTGYYDLLTTTGVADYALAQSGWPKDRVRIVRYEGGHMAYTVEKSLKKMMDDVRALVLGKS